MWYLGGNYVDFTRFVFLEGPSRTCGEQQHAVPVAHAASRWTDLATVRDFGILELSEPGDEEEETAPHPKDGVSGDKMQSAG